MQVINNIQANQQKVLELMDKEGYFSSKKRKLNIEGDKLELEKIDFLMEKCKRYKDTPFAKYWKEKVETQLKQSCSNEDIDKKDYVEELDNDKDNVM